MRTQVVFAAFCGSALGLARPPVATINPTCARDNCLRAVIASAAFPSPSSAAADCSSFFLKTITPATVTSTVYASATETEAAVTLTNTNLFSTTLVETAAATTTVLSTDTFSVITTSTTYMTLAPMVSPVPRDLKPVARQVTGSPYSVPRYASACSGTVRYSSACSCIGILTRFTTVAAPTTVVTITNTISFRSDDTNSDSSSFHNDNYRCDHLFRGYVSFIRSTTTTEVIASVVTCSAVPTSFWLVAQGAGVDGQYVVTTGKQDEIIDTFSTNIGEATQFSIRGGNLWQNIYEANTDNTDIGTIFFNTPGFFSNIVYLTCSTASDFAGPLTCSGYNGNSIFQLCPDGIHCQGGVEPCGGVSLGNTVDPRCQAISFTAVPACNSVVGG